MTNMLKCWKNTDASNLCDQALLRIGESVYTLGEATKDERKKGSQKLSMWRVERQYQVQVCGPDSPRPYYEWRNEVVEIPFEELIFSDGECIGIYHEDCVLLFDDPKTHRRPKWLGEFIIGPDRTFDAYDFYLLIQNELQ